LSQGWASCDRKRKTCAATAGYLGERALSPSSMPGCRIDGRVAYGEPARPFSSFKKTEARTILSRLSPQETPSFPKVCLHEMALLCTLFSSPSHALCAGMRVSSPESRELLYTLRVQTLPDNSTRSAYEFFHRAHGSEVLGSTWLYTHAGRAKHGSRRQYHLP